MQRVRLATTIVIALVLIAAGVGIWWIVESHPSGASPRPTIRADGPTLLKALGDVNRLIRNETGGPWDLYWFVGVAAESSFSANVVGYGLQVNLTANACGDLYDGLTLWNGTMPVFNGTFDSGTAPFWQFAFYSNSTQLSLLVTDVLGLITVYPEANITSTLGCYPWDDAPNPEAWVRGLSGPLVDSPTIVQTALQRVNESLLLSTSPSVEILTSGPGAFPGVAETVGSLGAFYERCGLRGVTGIQPISEVYEAMNGSFGGLFNGTTNCAYLNHPYFAGYGSYKLLPATSTQSGFGSTIQVTTTIQVALASPNGSVTSYDGWGLANWMTSWNLINSTGAQLHLVRSGCDSWVASLQQCAANSTGWYLFVLSQGGKWIDSYGLSANGTAGWSMPITALVSHYQVVLVAPSAWSLTGDTLAIGSTVATSTVTGSIAL
jgi:hypothetical protein